MKVAVAILLTIGGVILIAAGLRSHQGMIQPKRAELALPESSSADQNSPAPKPEQALKETPREINIPAVEKARFIDEALNSGDAAMMSKAEVLVRAMMQTGSTAEVLAAIPKVVMFSQSVIDDVTAMQFTLCRFQSTPENNFGFELIKVKFDLILGNEPKFKSWQSVCGA